MVFMALIAHHLAMQIVRDVYQLLIAYHYVMMVFMALIAHHHAIQIV